MGVSLNLHKAWQLKTFPTGTALDSQGFKSFNDTLNLGKDGPSSLGRQSASVFFGERIKLTTLKVA